MFTIIENEELVPTVHRIKIKAPLVAQKCMPGQFVIIVIDEKGERVPFTLSGWDRELGTIEFVYIEVGKTTQQLAQLKSGDSIAHVVGPLGRPSEIDHFGNVITVVSGYGISAIVPILKALKEKENHITTIVRAPDHKRLFGEPALKDFSDKLILALGEDGSGVIESLRNIIDTQPVDRIILMSSLCLMHVIAEITRPYGIKTMVHLTPLMVDGTGMCGACRVRIAGENKFACVDGPEFDGHKVENWEALMARRCSYADESIFQQSFQCRNCSQW